MRIVGATRRQPLLALATALRRLDEFDDLFQPPIARSIDELEDQERRRSEPRRQRGTI